MTMFLKIVGALLVLSASGLLGYSISKGFARRPQELRDLQGMLQMLENEIGFMSNILKDSFRRISGLSSGPVAVIFQRAADILRDKPGTNASEAWEEAVKKNIWNTSMNEEDEFILIAFGKMLGTSDMEGQIKNIRLTVSQLRLQEQKAEEARRKNEKLYGSLGVLGGIAVVIVLI